MYIYDAMFLGKISVHLEGVKSLAVGCVGYENEVESSDENNLEEVQKSVHSEPIVDTESGKKSIKGLYRTLEGAQWLSGKVLDSRPSGRGLEPHWRHCIVVLGQEHLS